VRSFGPFRLDPRTGVLTRNGIRVRLQPQQARLLTLITSRPGRVYRREEIYQELWSDQAHGNFDQSLNFTVSQLRTALKDSAESSHYIETIPKLGYRFVAVVEESASPENARQESAGQESKENGTGNGWHGEEPSDLLPDGIGEDGAFGNGPIVAGPTVVEAQAARNKRTVRRRWVAVLVAGSLLGIFAAAWWYLPLQPPRAYGFTQITTADAIDFPVKPVTDGARIFYIERAGGHWITRQASLGGGEPQPVPGIEENTRIMDLSPDRTTYLLGRFTSRGSTSTLWLMPVQGGQPQRLGDMVSGEAIWHPDGKHIVFAREKELWIVGIDGADAKRLVALPGGPNWLAWSPDGERMRLSLTEENGRTSLWEMQQDGTNLHRLIAGSAIEEQCCGEWTPDGRYFIFTGGNKNAWNLWALREPGFGLRRAPLGPFQLTEWPGGLFGASVSPDGESVLFYGGRNRSQIQRFDIKSKRLIPLTSEGYSQPDFSLDGRWIVYADMNVDALWKMDTQSGKKVQLGPVGFSVTFPRWSPDGRQLAMTASDHGAPGTVYLISASGGTPEPLLPGEPHVTDPDWSPDGKTLVVVHPIPGQQQEVALFLVDLATRKETMVPGSNGRFFPHWSPDGRHIAAYADDGHGVDIYSFATHTWQSIVTAAAIGFPTWSRDGRYLYYQRILEEGEPVYRFNEQAGRTEMVARFDEELAGGISRCAFMGLAPDNTLLVDTTRGSRDLYRAKLTLPR
jgi:Tol biopolymer transport system component/DNA-binding winged helix-turn-helix (wHTH) protein